MFDNVVWRDLVVMTLCYAYIGLIILVADTKKVSEGFAPETARRFLHAMVARAQALDPCLRA